MKEHFGLTDDSYSDLIKKGVTEKYMFNSIPLFDPDKTGAKIGYVGLFYYIDKKGDFNKKPLFPHKKIAHAVFETLSPSQKMNILKYIDDYNDGEL